MDTPSNPFALSSVSNAMRKLFLYNNNLPKNSKTSTKSEIHKILEEAREQ